MIRNLTFGLLGLLSATTLADGPRTMYPPWTKPTLIAHRGASGDAPEHTLAAYKRAIEVGADLVEPDIQVTKDGVPICLHDTTLERTTDVEAVFPYRSVVAKGKKTWPVADFTLAELKTLDAGVWKGEQFAGERVVTFDELVTLVRGKVGLLVETKAPDANDRAGVSMERRVLDVLEKHGLATPGADPKTPIVFQSFSADSLKAFQALGSDLPRLLLVGGKDWKPALLDDLSSYATGIAPNKAIVAEHPEMVAAAHAKGLSVTVWTFRKGEAKPYPDVRAEMAAYLTDRGIDACITDNPDQFPRELAAADPQGPAPTP